MPPRRHRVVCIVSDWGRPRPIASCRSLIQAARGLGVGKAVAGCGALCPDQRWPSSRRDHAGCISVIAWLSSISLVLNNAVCLRRLRQAPIQHPLNFVSNARPRRLIQRRPPRRRKTITRSQFESFSVVTEFMHSFTGWSTVSAAL